MENGKIIKKTLWQSKWGKYSLPITLNEKDRGNQAFIEIFNKYFNERSKNEQKSVFEIGCAPGRFLIHFSKSYNFKVHGIEYSEKGYTLTKNNLHSCDIEGNIIKEDIFNYNISYKFDAVISCGFIEHFSTKLDKLLEIHANLVKKGGKVFISFPNFKYLNYLFSYFFRSDMLPLHNLEIMNKEFFIRFANKYGFKILYLDYFGGIHPGGLKLSQKEKVGIFSKFASNYIIDPMASSLFLNSINSKYFSRYLGAVMQKR